MKLQIFIDTCCIKSLIKNSYHLNSIQINACILSNILAEKLQKREGGASIRVMSLVENLQKSGTKVCLIARATRSYAESTSNIRLISYKRFFGSVMDRPEFGMTFCSNILSGMVPTFLLHKKIRDTINSAGIVQIEQDGYLNPGLVYFIKRFQRKAVILDMHDVYYPLISEILSTIKFNHWIRLILLNFIRRVEEFTLNHCDAVIVVSENDRILIESLYRIPKNKIHIIPNGTDTFRFKPDNSIRKVIRKNLHLGDNIPIILFVGNLSYVPNKLAVESLLNDVFPKVLQKFGDARLLIVGKGSALFRNLETNNVIFTDYVEDEVPYINSSDICVAPLTLGGGTRIKILNYMACAKPVVSTEKGAQGLQVKHGHDIFITSTDDFADAICYALENYNQAQEVGNRARVTVAENYSWSKIALDLTRVYDSLKS